MRPPACILPCVAAHSFSLDGPEQSDQSDQSHQSDQYLHDLDPDMPDHCCWGGPRTKDILGPERGILKVTLEGLNQILNMVYYEVPYGVHPK